MDCASVTVRFCMLCGELIRMGRVRNRTEFCEAVGLKVSNYLLMEKGVRTVPLSRVCGAVSVYGVSVAWLFHGEGSVFRGGECDG